MRTHKLITLAAGALMCLGSFSMLSAQPAGGQGPGGGGRQGGGQLMPRNDLAEAVATLGEANLLPNFNLTDEQKQKIAEVRTAYRADVEKWRSDHAGEIETLTKQMQEMRDAGQQADPEKRRALNQARQTLMQSVPTGEAQAGQLIAVLTPEQKGLYDTAAAEIVKEREAMRALFGQLVGGGGGRRAGGGGGGGGN